MKKFVPVINLTRCDETYCFICQENDSGSDRLTKCSEASYQRKKEFTGIWSKYGRHIPLQERLSTLSWSEGAIHYHRKCSEALTEVRITT